MENGKKLKNGKWKNGKMENEKWKMEKQNNTLGFGGF